MGRSRCSVYSQKLPDHPGPSAPVESRSQFPENERVWQEDYFLSQQVRFHVTKRIFILKERHRTHSSQGRRPEVRPASQATRVHRINAPMGWESSPIFLHMLASWSFPYWGLKLHTGLNKLRHLLPHTFSYSSSVSPIPSVGEIPHGCSAKECSQWKAWLKFLHSCCNEEPGLYHPSLKLLTPSLFSCPFLPLCFSPDLYKTFRLKTSPTLPKSGCKNSPSHWGPAKCSPAQDGTLDSWSTSTSSTPGPHLTPQGQLILSHQPKGNELRINSLSNFLWHLFFTLSSWAHRQF